MIRVGRKIGRGKLAAIALASIASQAGCSGALWGNFAIVLLALAIFVGTIRLGGGGDDEKPGQ
ncbi:MAG: hypothetical protein HY905_27410 [Deltaproteobacteria bacterium]|nr:hypothetical protein [Deltaproteobacteria bacterium]